MQPQNALVHINRICEFLADKNLVPNKLEGRILINRYTSGNQVNYMTFEKIFLKPIFKGGLLNLANNFNNFDSTLPLRLKLGMEQRKVMLAGTKPSLNLSSKHGRLVLNSLDKFKQKNRETKKTVDVVLEEAEEVNEERLLGYLYSLKDEAKSFLNEKGELQTNSKNTWDLREEINPVEDKSVLSDSQRYRHSTYLSILNNKSIGDNSKHIILTPKVKLFRDNYVWKRFEGLVNKFPKS